ncbi:MAG TPA: DUF503 domain-containing protein [bacterium]|nr:DUF503 domain-containing protein [bacterium]
MVVGVLHLDLRFHDCRSLKEKRSCIRQLLSRVKSTFEVAVAEVGSQDKWQRAEVGIAAVGSDRAGINQRLDHVINFVEGLGSADLVDHKIELINV